MEDKQIEQISHLLKSMAHPIRLKILCSLKDSELSAGELLEQTNTSNANLSQHLSVLREFGLIQTRREANFLYNSIADQRVVELINKLQHIFCQESKENKK